MVQHALKVLSDDPDRVKPFLTEVYPTAIGVIMGFSGFCFFNAVTRRPLLSGIQRHVIAAAFGGFMGKTIDGWRDQHMAERDAILRYYVETHPEDFPDPEVKKFGQLFDTWVPIR